ncbi:MAG: hypothetical protein ACJ8EL_02250 [Rhizomicrobium sp.]|jgi:hypothetical protein
MKSLINLALGAIVAGILVAPVAWADAQKLVRTGFTVHDVATSPDLWRPAITVIHSALLTAP